MQKPGTADAAQHFSSLREAHHGLCNPQQRASPLLAQLRGLSNRLVDVEQTAAVTKHAARHGKMPATGSLAPLAPAAWTAS
jgi:hypothetical protein